MRHTKYLIEILMIFLISLSLVQIVSAYPVHNVNKGTDYTTIQAAIDDANTGNTIKVDSSIYYENINVNKQLIIQGNDTDNSKPIIDAMSNLYGIHTTVNGATIEGFVIRNGGIGIYIQSDYNIIKNNTINDNIDYGIYIYPSSYNTIENNVIDNNDDFGIYGYQSSHNTIENNIINNNFFGIRMEENSNWNDIAHNTFSNSGRGMSIWASTNNNISYNTANDGQIGIDIGSLKNSIIRSNIANNNSEVGIDIYNSYDNQIYDNIFNNTNNLNYYILDHNVWNLTKILGTNIIEGQYIGGNYWANPSGTGFSQFCTNRGDGFCDTNYILDSNNIDYLPLTNNPASDNIPPIVTIATPVEGDHYRSTTLPELSYSVTDNLDTNPTISITGWYTEEGIHTVTVNATDNAGNVGSASVTYTVDNTPPVVTLNGDNPVTIYIGSTYIDNGATATDNFDGPVPVTSSDSVDTNMIGTYTITYTATDSAGNPASTTRTIKVIYNFAGFFQPVDNLPTWNSVKAGSAIPTKFSLNGDQGLDIFATDYPKSQNVDCISSTPIDAIEETVTAGSSSLSYNVTTDQYNYIWKTDKAWKNSCRQLMLLLKDGTYHNASFNLR